MDTDYKKALEGRTIKEVTSLEENDFEILLDDGTKLSICGDNGYDVYTYLEVWIERER